jgi:outer membrane protein assembly factor BamB
MALENGELIRLDPFGRVRSRKLPEVPAAALSPERPAENGEAWEGTLVFYRNGDAEILSGEASSRFRLPGPILAAAGRGDKAAALLGDGRVILLSARGGETIWTGSSHLHSRQGDTGAEMLFDERGIYILSKSGASGFTEDGRRLWIMRLEGAAAIPSFGDDGILYSGGGDWVLYAYKLEDRIRQGRQSLYGPVPEGSYGTGSPPPSSWAGYPFRFNEDELGARLGEMERILRSGRVGAEELDYTAYLMELIGADLGLVGAAKSPPRVQVRHRVRALRLLALIGSGETIPFLTDVFSRDGEVVVRAAAADAIGLIGTDPAGMALRAFAGTLYSPALRQDEQVLIAVAGAAGALCRFSGPPLSETGVRLLTGLSAETMPRAVRARAGAELDSLR